ncbi:MAG: TldD/PmbA family protein [Spirochaetota bacterium]
MYNFPAGLYTDVRIEDINSTNIAYTLGNLEQSRVRKYKAAFIRIYDGNKWYYGSTTDYNNIQKEIDKLAKLANPNNNIDEDPVVKKFEVNKGKFLEFRDNDISKIDKKDKDKLLTSLFPLLKENKKIKNWQANYIDLKKIREFYSSKGSELITDYQKTGVSFFFQMSNEQGKRVDGKFDKGANTFDEIKGQEDKFKDVIKQTEDFMEKSQPVKPGKYTVIFSPVVAGVFAHESFGHKSEADFMIGDENMKKEWTIGKEVGVETLSIVDDGNEMGVGYTPYDDEGTKAKKTYLIKDGKLSGRLHSTLTASDLEEELTGNARATNFEFEPIVRMTTTYIMPGKKTKDELISEIKEGILVEDLKHGSGMSTFTIAPTIAYMIRDGKIAEPVSVSVLTGNVFKTLGEIDGLSNELELFSFVRGGCGKMEQFPLSVGFGGPYVRINNINVQ